jgi:hypothetical protein
MRVEGTIDAVSLFCSSLSIFGITPRLTGTRRATARPSTDAGWQVFYRINRSNKISSTFRLESMTDKTKTVESDIL